MHADRKLQIKVQVSPGLKARQIGKINLCTAIKRLLKENNKKCKHDSATKI